MDTNNRSQALREGMAKILREVSGYDEYYASLHPNHRGWDKLSLEAKERWLLRADKVVSFLASQGLGWAEGLALEDNAIKALLEELGLVKFVPLEIKD